MSTTPWLLTGRVYVFQSEIPISIYYSKDESGYLIFVKKIKFSVFPSILSSFVVLVAYFHRLSRLKIVILKALTTFLCEIEILVLKYLEIILFKVDNVVLSKTEISTSHKNVVRAFQIAFFVGSRKLQLLTPQKSKKNVSHALDFL